MFSWIVVHTWNTFDELIEEIALGKLLDNLIINLKGRMRRMRQTCWPKNSSNNPVFVMCRYFMNARCLKITEKLSFDATYVYILSGQKLIKMQKMVHFGNFFWKPEAYSLTVLPDRSLLIGQKSCKIFKYFAHQQCWKNSSNCPGFVYLMSALIWRISPNIDKKGVASFHLEGRKSNNGGLSYWSWMIPLRVSLVIIDWLTSVIRLFCSLNRTNWFLLKLRWSPLALYPA